MSLAQLFNITLESSPATFGATDAPDEDGVRADKPAAKEPAVGALITLQTLATFPGATAAVSAIVAAVATISNQKPAPWWVAIVTFSVMTLVFLLNEQPPKSRSKKISRAAQLTTSLLIAIVNSAQVFMAVWGGCELAQRVGSTAS
jgi:hypothetical protein